eukprot:7384133-Prymnesium_polylepis.1
MSGRTKAERSGPRGSGCAGRRVGRRVCDSIGARRCGRGFLGGRCGGFGGRGGFGERGGVGCCDAGGGRRCRA